MKKVLFLLPALLLGSVLAAKPQLTGNTNKPTTSIFALGEKVELTFQVKGLKPGEQTQLLLNIVDENDKPAAKYTLSVKADAKGEWTGKVNPPCGKYGFWRVWGKLADGTELPKVFSRPAGFITYAVVPGEKRYKVYPIEETFWGNHGPSFGYHRMIGLRWGGNGKNMITLEQKKGAYADNPDAAKVELLYKNPEWKEYWQTNQNQLPKWFNTPEYVMKKNGKYAGYTPKGEAYYGKYLEIFAENYEKQMLKHQPFTLIQVTWEPMYPWGFGGTPEDLVRIHEIAYKAVHKRTKHTKLMGPTSAGLNSVEWHVELFKAGLLKYIDVLSIHPYFALPPEQNNMVQVIRRLKAEIRRYNNGKDIPIIGNEAGFDTLEKVERESIQMYGLLRANLILLGEGFKYNMVFYSHDFPGEPGYGITYNLNPRKHFGTDMVAPKPVFPAIGGAALILNGHTSAGAIEYLGDTAWGYTYQRKDGFVTLALWDYSGNPREVEIPVGRKEIELADMMGNTRKVKTQNGVLKLTLTEAPTYVIDVNPDLWGRTAVKKIQPKSEKIPAVAGSEIVLSGKVLALKDGLDGTLVAEFPKQDGIRSISQKMESSFFSKEKSFELKTVLPKNFRAGDHSVMLKFVRNGVTAASTGVLLQVRPPVELVKILPAFRDGKPGFRFTLNDLSGKGQKGSLEVRIKGNPEGRVRQHFTLKSGETKELALFYDSLETNPLKEEEMDATLKTSDGIRIRSRQKLNLLSAAKRSAGNWDNLRWGTLTNDMKVDPAKVTTGADDLTGKIAFAWNEKYLMFRAVTVDNIHCQPHTGWQTWNGDCIQMGFTKAWRLQETGNLYQDKMDRAYSELDFALTAKGPEVYRTITFSEKDFPLGPVSLKECPLTVTKKVLPDGKIELTYTGCIPWRFLNIPVPKKGMILGWGMTVNDRDKAKGFKYDFEVFKLKKTPQFGAIVLD